MIHNALRQELLDNSTVTALIGESTAARIYPQIARQGVARPLIVYSQISADHAHHLRGAAGLVQARFQIDSYGADAAGARLLSDKVRLALDGQYDTTFGSGDYTAAVRSCVLEDEREGFDTPFDGGQSGVHRVIQTFSIWHTETVPTFA